MPNWVVNHLQIHGENAVKVLRSLLTEDKKSGDGYRFDFNKIKPMPKSLNIESGSLTNECIEMYMTSQNPQVDYYGSKKMSVKKFERLKEGLNTTKYFSEYNVQLPLEELTKRLKYFLEYFKTPDFESRALLQGKTAVDNLDKYGAKDWYDWSIGNWGTKWNACDTQIPDPETAEVYFDTAWSPVTELMCALSEKYPDYSFEYAYAEEQAGNFAGSVIFKNGDEISGGHYNNESKECYEIFFDLWGMEDEFKFNNETGTYEHIENEAEM